MQLHHLLPLALLASFVAATPLETRGTRVTAVKAGKPEFSPANSTPKDSVTPQVASAKGATVVSKRSDVNVLSDRSSTTLIVCTDSNCGGYCLGYSLDIPHGQCYETDYYYNSVYVSNGGVGLPYGVYVGTDCYGSSSLYIYSFCLVPNIFPCVFRLPCSLR